MFESQRNWHHSASNRVKATALNLRMAFRRIYKEYKDIIEDPPIGCSLSVNPLDRNPFQWDAWIHCENKNSPHFGGCFNVKIDLPEDYPFKAPKVRFASKIYHPQLWQSEHELCLSVLGHHWSPALTVSRVLMQISAMIQEPFSEFTECRCCGGQIDENYIKERTRDNKTGATAAYLNDRQRYNVTARAWTQKYAFMDANSEQNESEQSTELTQPVDQQNADGDDENREQVEEEEKDPCVRLLCEWNLSQYKAALVNENGYDEVNDWKYITKDELIEDMKFKVGHSNRFLRNVQAYFKESSTTQKPDVSNNSNDDDTVKKLIELSNMGFEDHLLNSALLRQQNGNLEKVLDILLQCK